MTWTNQQESALNQVGNWYKARENQVFRLFGYAGTGKTTLARHLANTINGRTSFCAFTGKASLVMRKNGCSGASTIHSLIYKPEGETSKGQPTFIKNMESDIRSSSLIIVDECSMVDEQIGKDLLSFGVPVLVLGDPAQLPPVSGAGYFTNGRPDSMLTEIHRQAADNPIIRMATDTRLGKTLEYGNYGDSKVIRRSDLNLDEMLNADQILTGRNATRKFYNERVRKVKKFESEFPIKGDKLICLKNDKEFGIFNGGMFSAYSDTKIGTTTSVLVVKSEDFDNPPMRFRCLNECFKGGIEQVKDYRVRKGYQEFDFGYAITVHKSQGSQWDYTYMFDESSAFARQEGMPQRWRYTGLTRSSEKVVVVR